MLLISKRRKVQFILTYINLILRIFDAISVETTDDSLVSFIIVVAPIIHSLTDLCLILDA